MHQHTHMHTHFVFSSVKFRFGVFDHHRDYHRSHCTFCRPTEYHTLYRWAVRAAIVYFATLWMCENKKCIAPCAKNTAEREREAKKKKLTAVAAVVVAEKRSVESERCESYFITLWISSIELVCTKCVKQKQQQKTARRKRTKESPQSKNDQLSFAIKSYGYSW